MIQFMIKHFVKGNEFPQDPVVRGRYGKFASIVGMIANLFLFAMKFAVGMISGSVAIQTDSFNNLSDAATCFINLFGFHLAGKPADRDHPFGHGRIEYITGMIMSFLVMLIGFEFLRSSIDRIIHPSPLEYSPFMLVILIGSILIKFWMFLFYRRIGITISSQPIIASSVDAVSDIMITAVTVISLVISVFFGIAIDGFVGAGVSLIVLYAGFTLAKGALSPLLGGEPDPVMVESLQTMLTEDQNILGVHDLIIHDYGPGRKMASAHVEVSSSGNFSEIHDTVDLLEKRIAEKLHIPITIHMDPIVTDDGETEAMRDSVQQIVQKISDKMSIHDFRMVTGKTHTNLIFDIVVPFDIRMSDGEIKEKIESELALRYNTVFFVVIQFDRSYL